MAPRRRHPATVTVARWAAFPIPYSERSTDPYTGGVLHPGMFYTKNRCEIAPETLPAPHPNRRAAIHSCQYGLTNRCDDPQEFQLPWKH